MFILTTFSIRQCWRLASHWLACISRGYSGSAAVCRERISGWGTYGLRFAAKRKNPEIRSTPLTTTTTSRKRLLKIGIFPIIIFGAPKKWKVTLFVIFLVFLEKWPPGPKIGSGGRFRGRLYRPLFNSGSHF